MHACKCSQVSAPQHLSATDTQSSSPTSVRRGVLIVSLIIALLGSSSCGTDTAGESLNGHILLVGATTMLPLLNAAAALYHQQNPQVRVEVRGGGSVVGLNAVNNHQADIGTSSIYADPALYSDPNLTDHLVCVIPGALVVGPGVPISSLSRQQITAIFTTGSIHNWQDVGGPDLPITPVMRADTSGIRVIFHKYILGNSKEIGTLLSTNSDTEMRDAIARTPGAIGYLALPYVNASVHEVAIDNVSARPQDIENGQYTFWGYGHMYTLGSSNVLVTSFLSFMLTPSVQQLAQKVGYIPINAVKLPTARV